MTVISPHAAGAAFDMAIRHLREARILALQALCQFDVQGDEFQSQLDGFLRDSVEERTSPGGKPLPPEAIKLAGDMARGAWSQHAGTDRRIAASSQSWSVGRMALVDRNILRLAVYELLEQPETPFKVVINEALELAHQFSDGESSAFVNGVLDAVWRQIQIEADAIGQQDD